MVSTIADVLGIITAIISLGGLAYTGILWLLGKPSLVAHTQYAGGYRPPRLPRHPFNKFVVISSWVVVALFAYSWGSVFFDYCREEYLGKPSAYFTEALRVFDIAAFWSSLFGVVVTVVCCWIGNVRSWPALRILGLVFAICAMIGAVITLLARALNMHPLGP